MKVNDKTICGMGKESTLGLMVVYIKANINKDFNRDMAY